MHVCYCRNLNCDVYNWLKVLLRCRCWWWLCWTCAMDVLCFGTDSLESFASQQWLLVIFINYMWLTALLQETANEVTVIFKLHCIVAQASSTQATLWVVCERPFFQVFLGWPLHLEQPVSFYSFVWYYCIIMPPPRRGGGALSGDRRLSSVWCRVHRL